MQHVHVKLNPGLPCKSSIQHEEDSFHKQVGLKFKEETSKFSSSILYGAETWTLREKKTSETVGKFSNMVLEKDGEDQLDRSCKKRSSVTRSQRGKEYPSYNEKSEG